VLAVVVSLQGFLAAIVLSLVLWGLVAALFWWLP
jgi:hypothetical protein